MRFDATDGKRIQWSFNALAESGTPESTLTAIQRQVIYSLPRAEYFVTNQYHPSQWSYFDFGICAYANFTSPIRRFADMVTHRSLAYVLALEAGSEAATAVSRARAAELGIKLPAVDASKAPSQALVPDSPAMLLRFADVLNRAVHGAKLVQQKVERIYMYYFLTQHPTVAVLSQAVVTAIGKDYVVCFCGEFGIEERIFVFSSSFYTLLSMDPEVRAHLRLRSDGTEVVLTEFVTLPVRLVPTRSRSDLDVGLQLVSPAFVEASSGASATTGSSA